MRRDNSTAANTRIVGQVIGGEFGRVAIRQKAGIEMEIGDILVLEEKDYNILLMVFDLQYASQMDDKMHEMISGVSLEEDSSGNVQFYEPNLVNYVIAHVKPLVRVKKGGSPADGEPVSTMTKTLPPFTSKLRSIEEEDLKFLDGGKDGLFVGRIRSGSEVKNVEVRLPINKIFTHHVLISATTGRGKSNLVKSMLWHVLESRAHVGILVLDAHDEYYSGFVGGSSMGGSSMGVGRRDAGPGQRPYGLRDHPDAVRKVAYYSVARDKRLPGTRTLLINIQSVKPDHFDGVVDFSEAQRGAIHTYYNRYKEQWIRNLMTINTTDTDGSREEGTDDKRSKKFSASTLNIIRRKLEMVLGLYNGPDNTLRAGNTIFDVDDRGGLTIREITDMIERGQIVVLDTSHLHSETELVVGNIIASELLNRYKRYKITGELRHKPVTSIVIEEAPRVIGADVLKSGNSNIYATIAREGRKFKVGLTAITQLSSVIPRSILANMNTKIILGNELKQERMALIDSASQDLSDDDKNIASLNIGEAIITSVFVPFAMPVKIPLFEDVAASAARHKRHTNSVRVFG